MGLNQSGIRSAFLTHPCKYDIQYENSKQVCFEVNNLLFIACSSSFLLFGIFKKVRQGRDVSFEHMYCMGIIVWVPLRAKRVVLSQNYPYRTTSCAMPALSLEKTRLGSSVSFFGISKSLNLLTKRQIERAFILSDCLLKSHCCLVGCLPYVLLLFWFTQLSEHVCFGSNVYHWLKSLRITAVTVPLLMQNISVWITHLEKLEKLKIRHVSLPDGVTEVLLLLVSTSRSHKHISLPRDKKWSLFTLPWRGAAWRNSA